MVQLNRAVKNGADQMTVQLHPLELGTINIKLTFAGDGSVQGTVVASNAATLEMLTKDSRNLERALQDAGLRADPGSLQFSLGGQSDTNAGQTAYQGRDVPSARTNAPVAEMATTDLSTPDVWVVTPGRVNMKV